MPTCVWVASDASAVVLWSSCALQGASRLLHATGRTIRTVDAHGLPHFPLGHGLFHMSGQLFGSRHFIDSGFRAGAVVDPNSAGKTHLPPLAKWCALGSSGLVRAFGCFGSAAHVHERHSWGHGFVINPTSLVSGDLPRLEIGAAEPMSVHLPTAPILVQSHARSCDLALSGAKLYQNPIVVVRRLGSGDASRKPTRFA